jgi:hypothetical protein
MSALAKYLIRVVRNARVRRRVRSTPPLALAATAGVILAGGVAVALSAEPTRLPGPSATAQPSPASTVEPALTDAFGLLRRVRTAADVVPGDIPVVLSPASGANLALARRVAGPEGTEAWVIPGNEAACILAQASRYGLGGAVCNPTAGARAGQLDVQSASNRLPGAELVAGLVPDGVSSVQLTLAGGGTASVPVRENVYLAVVRGAVASISARGAQGTLHAPAMSAADVLRQTAPRG